MNLKKLSLLTLAKVANGNERQGTGETGQDLFRAGKVDDLKC